MLDNNYISGNKSPPKTDFTYTWKLLKALCKRVKNWKKPKLLLEPGW